MNTPHTPTASDFATFRQVANRLQVHVSTLRRLWREGRLPGYRLGHHTIRLKFEEVLSSFQGNQTPATPEAVTA